jgi:signal transduction histidine kinase
LWPFATVFNTRRAVHVPDLGGKFESLPTGFWHIPPKQAVVLPITLSGHSGRDAVMVVGLNPFRLFDDNYRGFLELTATQIAASMGNAHAYESERKRAESLVELDRAKTAFFSNVSHEFRTPLTLMISPLEETLVDAGELQPKHRQQLDMVHRNALRLLKLVNTLLDFSRIEAGRLAAVYEPTDLASYTIELASVFRSAIEKAGLRFLIECAPVSEPIFIDRDMWEKVVLNLLSNAFKFTLAGEVKVSLKEHGTFVELRVRDTGVGIPAGELLHVFERFHRVRTTEGRTHEGTGIGLALVQELIKLHGGTIRVQSMHRHGSTFIITVPKGKAHLPQDRISGALPHKSASNGARLYLEEALRWLPEDVTGLDAETESNDFLVEAAVAGPSQAARILLADDNADMRAYIRRLLERRYTVEAVVNGESALLAARAHPPDLLLSDVMMPRLDGFGLLAEMRSDPNLKTVPVILLSARAGEESRVEGLEAGADDYLTKPFSARELLARVRANLEMARVRQALAAEIEAERSFLKYIFDKAPAFVAVLRGPEHVIESFNPAFGQLVGRRELAGKAVREAFPELVRQGYLELLDEVYRTREPYSGQGVPILLQRRSGAPLDGAFVDFVYQPILAVDGSVSGIFVHGVDVTAQKESEKDRERLLAQEQDARKEAERANPLKDQFLATVSHELRTPLTAILCWAHVANRHRQAPPGCTAGRSRIAD